MFCQELLMFMFTNVVNVATMTSGFISNKVIIPVTIILIKPKRTIYTGFLQNIMHTLFESCLP